VAKNKQQLAAEARAKKSDNVQPAVGPNPGQINGDTGRVNEAPKPAAAVAPTALPAPASKQTQTIEKLKEAWIARGVDLSKLTITDEGKFKLLVVDAGWPTIQIGASGGIVLPVIKSYPNAFNAALEGDKLLAKQTARDAKKATPAPATAQVIPPAVPPAVPPAAKESPAAKKSKQHEAVEQQLATA
jgi:hypothetical protein